MKRIAGIALVSILALGVLAGCGGAKGSPAQGEQPAQQAPAQDQGQVQGPEQTQEPVTLTVGATVTPHSEILEFIKDKAEAEGIKLDIVVFTDYVQPNLALADGSLDANYFQHVPYLEQFSADRGLDLVSVGPVHLEPLGLYALELTSLDQLPDGATVSIPDDPTNAGRALKLLADHGLIELKEGVGVKATPNDIVANPKSLKIEMLQAEFLPRSLQDVDAAVINTNYYLDAAKNLGVKANVLARESAENNPYANIVAVRRGDENRPEIKKLMELLQSEAVARFINENYDGAVVPAF
ncbi:MetQ/NlpA family ABC transporter substrate-binding protein [Symbiobacterium thermophilum]|uniref:Lipoprotein n=2 Tax=Symbiobacterium thermophilum TaxID=2734 RepID=A0A953I1E6_SYMTR|nr:MetQ/NlpA family ABC transporter substrate-binding protein [Symbiobacterium thermophilum]MBY6275191.1 methionine ABC transporter substrate-binding protein [Symbiobacterium thermophilum]